MPGNDELKSLEVWGNALPAICITGQTVLAAPEDMDEEAAEAWKAKIEAEDPAVEAFRGVSEMKGMPGTAPNAEEPERAWLVRVAGDQQQYSKVGEDGGNTSFCVNVLRSLRWPGAMTVAKGNKFTSVYVGYGIKKGDSCFNPTMPPTVFTEPRD